MGEELRELGAGLAVALEGEGRSEQPGRPLDEGEPFPFGNELRRNLLAVVLLQRRFVIEEIELRRGTGHEQVNDPFGLRREMRCTGSQRAVGDLRQQPFVEQGRQRQAADAEAGLLEEVAAGDRAKEVPLHHAPVIAW